LRLYRAIGDPGFAYEDIFVKEMDVDVVDVKGVWRRIINVDVK